MTQDKAAYRKQNWRVSAGPNLALTHYALLGLPPSASAQEIRRAYRELSKLYHPDTTDLTAEIATQKFHQLNEAYATLSSPERRLTYDQKIGFSRIHVIQTLQSMDSTVSQTHSARVSSAYLDREDRPLSPGELFALFILGITFMVCLVLAITVGLTRGEAAFQPASRSSPAIVQPAISPSHDLILNDQSVEQELSSSMEPIQESSADSR